VHVAKPLAKPRSMPAGKNAKCACSHVRQATGVEF